MISLGIVGIFALLALWIIHGFKRPRITFRAQLALGLFYVFLTWWALRI